MADHQLNNQFSDHQPITLGQILRKKKHIFVWSACERCGKERWVRREKGQPYHKFCRSCSTIERNKLPVITSPPKVGEVRHSKQLGRSGYSKFRWSACPGCGKERWVMIVWPSDYLCHKCGNKINRGSANCNWKGGRKVTDDGYIEVKVYDDDPLFPMVTKNGYVREHRLVMARHLQRCLLPWEIVHHKNGNRQDNRLSNLELRAADSDHITFSLAELDRLRKENQQLKARLAELEGDKNGSYS